MPKATLLEVVQYIGRQINSDEISALDETIESEDITSIALDTLTDIVERQDWEFLKDRPTQLNAGSDELSLALPTSVKRVQSIRYKTQDDGVNERYTTMRYISPEKYLCMLQGNSPTQPNTIEVNVNGVALVAVTNRPPRFWTSFDEQNIYFDSYDAGVDASGIDNTKSIALATTYLDYTGSDQPTWVAPIPEMLFTQWKQEAVAEASFALRQVENQRAERRSRRLYISNSRDEPVTGRDDGSESVNYGR